MAVAEKRIEFAKLHTGPGAFLLPNPWDKGSASLLEYLGFQALATTSAGYAFSAGSCDGSVAREAMIEHLAQIAASTALPVNADLENGYGRSPEEVFKTYRMADEAGVAGASIEDASGIPEAPIFALPLALDRLRAAVEAIRSSVSPMILTARCENHLHGIGDLSDTISRLQAYQEAGADVLYAPGLTRLEDIATVVRNLDRPVNVLASANMKKSELEALGVKRISVGSALSRAAYGALLGAAREMIDQGTFGFVSEAISFSELTSIFSRDRSQ